MEKEIDIEEVGQKAYRSSEQDGLTPIMVGILLMGVSLAFSFSPFYVYLAPISALLFIPVIAAIRKRVTYPRTGYVRLRAEKPMKKTMIGIFLFVFGVMAVGIIGVIILSVIFGDLGDPKLWRNRIIQWLPALFGMMMVGAFLYLASKSGQARYYAFASLLVAGGIAFSIIDFGSGYTGITLFLLSIGVLSLIYGTIQFIRFLHNNPLPAAEASDGKN